MVPLVAPPPPGSVVVTTCQDDHQKVKGFLLRRDFWGFVPHLMRSGGAVHIVATWCVLTGGVNALRMCLLSFTLIFSFLCLVFKLPFFSLSSSLSLSFAIAPLYFCFSKLLSLRFFVLFLPMAAFLRYDFFSPSLLFVE